MSRIKNALFRCGLLSMMSISTAALAQTYTIHGYVKDLDTGEPLPGVYVTTGTQGNQTNSKGFFQLKDVPRGSVEIRTMYFSSYSGVKESLELTKDTILHLNLRESPLPINEVVITSSRSDKRLAETPVLTTLIREQEIRKSSAVNVMEALQDYLPGIVTSANAMGNNLRIKGLNSRYIVFLVDGERMVSEGAGGNINLDQIDVNSIKRIEIINGAASALYGSNAVGAVINIITKDPVHPMEGGANISLESNNTWKMKVDAGTKRDQWNARINAFRHTSDGFGADGSGPYAAKYADLGSGLKMGAEPSDRLKWTLDGRYFRHETFNPENSMNRTHPLTHTYSVGGTSTYKTDNELHSLKLSAQYDRYLDQDVLEQSGKQVTANRASFGNLRLTDAYVSGAFWEWITGLEYNREVNYAEKTLGVLPTTKSLDDYNAFMQVEFAPSDVFALTSGARLTYNPEYGMAFTPKISGLYRLNDWTLRAGVGTAFRAPSIKELYYDFDHQGMFWVYGNPDLESERGVYSSLSAEYSIPTFNASMSVYWNEISNKITQYDQINSQGALEKYYRNVSSARLRGVDVSLSYVLLRDWVLKGNYSFCDALDQSTGLQLSSNVKHSATMGVTWNGKLKRSPFSVQLAGRMHSPKLYQELTTDADGVETVSLSESKPYSIWKLVLVKPFRLEQHTLELTLKADNIGNFKETSYINPGRQYLIGLRYAFR
ncbi:MAG: TonB-dependent receptor [Bacteroidales bacterium]